MAMANVLSPQNLSFSITGYDLNEEFIVKAHKRFWSAYPHNSNFVIGDFLEAVTIVKPQLSLDFKADKILDFVNESADIVIANPPYVRTQILGAMQAQKLAAKFNLKGRVDLYYPFLMAMTESLKEGGILGVITSNRYLSTKGGESIRKFLSDNYEIIEIIDLGDTKLFDAAVLPAIFIGKKRKRLKIHESKTKFLKIYEELNGYKGESKKVNNIFEVLYTDGPGYFKIGTKKYQKTEGFLKYDPGSGKPWELLSMKESYWVSLIDKNAACRVGDLFKVRVGIKTTADSIFISDKWDQLGDDIPEETLLRDLLSQENIVPWGILDKIKLRVLYPHMDNNGKKQVIDIEKYPKAKKYLYSHEEKLKNRKYLIDAGRKWFEIWVPQNPVLWDKAKLVFPDISSHPRFCFDSSGRVVNGNCYWIVAEKPTDIEKLLLIQGVANSKLMTQYHDLVFNNKLYSGRRRYFSQYVERYPLPDIKSNIAKEIIDIVIKLNKITDLNIIYQLEKELEIKISQSFNVPISSDFYK